MRLNLRSTAAQIEPNDSICPSFVCITGDKYWYVAGKLHRESGPAIEYVSGRKEWWLQGKLHRENGPAIEHANGAREWWIAGKRQIKSQISRPSLTSTQKEKTIFLMKWN